MDSEEEGAKETMRQGGQDLRSQGVVTPESSIVSPRTSSTVARVSPILAGRWGDLGVCLSVF